MRLANGRPLHYLGEGYLVLSDGVHECSMRNPAGIYVGWQSIGQVAIVSLPLTTNLVGEVRLEATRYADRLLTFLEDDDKAIMQVMFDRVVHAKGHANVDFTRTYEMIA